MQRTRDFLAVDLGASSGRVLAGRWDGSRFALQEVHRFANEPASQMGRLQWDVLALWSQVKGGLARYAAWEPVEEPTGSATPRRGEMAGLGLDTWGSTSRYSTESAISWATRTTTATGERSEPWPARSSSCPGTRWSRDL